MREAEGSSRFRRPPDPSFWELNRSLPVDRWLAPYDIRQSVAHAGELARLGVLDEDELHRIREALEQIALEFEDGSFVEIESDEDVHMAIERRLGELAGPSGGKLHTGRSRNDQVATVPVGIGEGEPCAAAAVDGADLREAHQAVHQTRTVDPEVHRVRGRGHGESVRNVKTKSLSLLGPGLPIRWARGPCRIGLGDPND